MMKCSKFNRHPMKLIMTYVRPKTRPSFKVCKWVLTSRELSDKIVPVGIRRRRIAFSDLVDANSRPGCLSGSRGSGSIRIPATLFLFTLFLSIWCIAVDRVVRHEQIANGAMFALVPVLNHCFIVGWDARPIYKCCPLKA